MLLDTSVKEQSFIEDCEICCNPIELKIEFADKELVNFEVTANQ